jgi:hypothetical protein
MYIVYIYISSFSSLYKHIRNLGNEKWHETRLWKDSDSGWRSVYVHNSDLHIAGEATPYYEFDVSHRVEVWTSTKREQTVCVCPSASLLYLCSTVRRNIGLISDNALKYLLRRFADRVAITFYASKTKSFFLPVANKQFRKYRKYFRLNLKISTWRLHHILLNISKGL